MHIFAIEGTVGLGMIIPHQCNPDQFHDLLHHVMKETTGGPQVCRRMVGVLVMKESMHPADQGLQGVTVAVHQCLVRHPTGNSPFHVYSCIEDMYHWNHNKLCYAKLGFVLVIRWDRESFDSFMIFNTQYVQKEKRKMLNMIVRPNEKQYTFQVLLERMVICLVSLSWLRFCQMDP